MSKDWRMEEAKQRYLKRRMKLLLASYIMDSDGLSEAEAMARVQEMETKFATTFEANLADNQAACGQYLERMTEI